MDTEDGNVTVYYEVKKNDIVFDKSKSENIKYQQEQTVQRNQRAQKNQREKSKKL